MVSIQCQTHRASDLQPQELLITLSPGHVSSQVILIDLGLWQHSRYNIHPTVHPHIPNIYAFFFFFTKSQWSIYLSICQRLVCQIFFWEIFLQISGPVNHGFTESGIWLQTQLKTCSCRNSETPFTLFVYSPTLQTQSHHSAINHHIRDPWNCQILITDTTHRNLEWTRNGVN